MTTTTPPFQPDVPVDLQPDAPEVAWTAAIDLEATYSAAEKRLTEIAAEFEQADEAILHARDKKGRLRDEEKNLVRLLKSRTPRRRTAK